jgi:hypothetical protein
MQRKSNINSLVVVKPKPPLIINWGVVVAKGKTNFFSVKGRKFFVCLRLLKGKEDFEIL